MAVPETWGIEDIEHELEATGLCTQTTDSARVKISPPKQTAVVNNTRRMAEMRRIVSLLIAAILTATLGIGVAEPASAASTGISGTIPDNGSLVKFKTFRYSNGKNILKFKLKSYKSTCGGGYISLGLRAKNGKQFTKGLSLKKNDVGLVNAFSPSKRKGSFALNGKSRNSCGGGSSGSTKFSGTLYY